MKKFLFALLLFLAIAPTAVFANSVNRINMDVSIDQNGTATIVEKWICHLTEGTEGYRGFSDLGQREIQDFSVVDDTGVRYEFLPNWNVNSSFLEKANKCGINKEGDKIELCWGISNYGTRDYTLSYKITNMVTEYQDYQGLYFNFLNLDLAVKNVKIKIHAPFNLTESNSKIWGFGYKGTCIWENGNIVLQTNGLAKSEYMVSLIKFEENLFATSATSEKTFAQIEKLAKKGSSYSGDVNKSGMGWFSLIIILLTVIPVAIYRNYGRFVRRKLPSMHEIAYFREVPCDGDLSYAYWIAKNYKIGKADKLKEGIIGATILKWIKENQVQIVETKGGIFDWGKNQYAIDFSNKNIEGESFFEKSLLSKLKIASGDNLILEPNEFKNWCKKNYISFEELFDKLDIKSKLIEKGLLVQEKQGLVPIYKETEQLREDALNLKGLQKYLQDFSLIHQREAKEVVLWEDYLIFANLLGIAKKVESQFKKLYPNLRTNNNQDLYMGSYVAMHFSHTGMHSAQAARNAANRASSGGGGGSFSGGGGFSGGSSGGGFR